MSFCEPKPVPYHGFDDNKIKLLAVCDRQNDNFYYLKYLKSNI